MCRFLIIQDTELCFLQETAGSVKFDVGKTATSYLLTVQGFLYLSCSQS